MTSPGEGRLRDALTGGRPLAFTQPILDQRLDRLVQGFLIGRPRPVVAA